MGAYKGKGPKSKEDCPFVFMWGTLCEHVYEKEVSRTLVDIRPNICGSYRLEKVPAEDFTVDLGRCEIFAVFQRKEDCKDDIDETLTFKTDIGDFSDAKLKIAMKRQHINFFHNSRLTNFPLLFAQDQRRVKKNVEFSFWWEGHKIGSIPVYLDISVEFRD